MNWKWLINPPKLAGRVSLLAGYIAGEVCSLYMVFIAHTINPVRYHLAENDLKLRAIHGRYQEIYKIDGLAFTVAASFAVFIIVLCLVRVIAFMMTSCEDEANVDDFGRTHRMIVGGLKRE